jgi:hypothetical protein
MRGDDLFTGALPLGRPAVAIDRATMLAAERVSEQ